MLADQDFETLLAQLRFLLVQPDDFALPISELAFQRLNLLLPPAWQGYGEHLAPLAEVPRMGTWPIAFLLSLTVAALPAEQAYLNIGVWNGFSLLAGMLARPQGLCIGVDNFSEYGAPREAFRARFAGHQGPLHRFYELDYVSYFETIPQPPLGVYFYDGPHTALDQRRGLELAEPHIVSGGLIFVDDSNLDEVRTPTLDFLAAHADYRLLADFRTARNAHPTWWNGLMILQKRRTAP